MKSFFESTRGQVLVLLRRGLQTVEDLAGSLGLTDNAVRAHLEALVRDGLVERRGVRRGVRKPHFTYALTKEAERLFPKAYHVLLNQVLAALRDRLTPQEFEAVMSDVAHSLASGFPAAGSGEDLASRVGRGLGALEAIGGAVRMVRQNEQFLIAGTDGCPFADAVTEHPEICRLAEMLLSEVTGLTVKEQCERSVRPRCQFAILDVS